MERAPKLNPLDILGPTWPASSTLKAASGINEAIRKMLPLGHKTAASGEQN
jgi:hypothetical protein